MLRGEIGFFVGIVGDIKQLDGVSRGRFVLLSFLPLLVSLVESFAAFLRLIAVEHQLPIADANRSVAGRRVVQNFLVRRRLAGGDRGPRATTVQRQLLL